MSDRTTAAIGSTLHSGLACESCGVTYLRCTEAILDDRKACCGVCGLRDTHEDQVEQRLQEGSTVVRPTIHIAIGNSDDSLTQAEWADYVSDVDGFVRRWAAQVHGYWHSMPDAPWQNAAWAFEVTDANRPFLRQALADQRATYRQDPIAWNESVTEFIDRSTP